MKLKKDFALREVADTWVVLPFGGATLDFNGMLTLNETGAVLWRALEQGGDVEALVAALTAEYDISSEIARADAEEFLAKLVESGCIEK